MRKFSFYDYTAPTPNRYLFGGKEFLTEDGLDEYCQGARQYVPRILKQTSDNFCGFWLRFEIIFLNLQIMWPLGSFQRLCRRVP